MAKVELAQVLTEVVLVETPPGTIPHNLAEATVAIIQAHMLNGDMSWLTAMVMELPVNGSHLGHAVRVKSNTYNPEKVASLSPRESQVMACLMKGLRAAAIADELGLHVRYIEKVIATVYNKLGVRRPTAKELREIHGYAKV